MPEAPGFLELLAGYITGNTMTLTSVTLPLSCGSAEDG